MSDNDATDAAKAREELAAALKAAGEELKPAVAAMAEAIKRLAVTVGPLLRRARHHAKLIAEAAAKAGAAKTNSPSAEHEQAARERSERFQ